jgi:hypothetical protein
MKFIRLIAMAVLTAGLVACGGGGGCASGAACTPGTTTTSVTATTTTAVTTVADVIFELDKTSIVNTGSDKAVLTVRTLDANRNVVSGVPVSVALDANAVYVSSGASTGTDGKLSGEITIGGDKSNRTINATIKVNSLVKVASVVVVGSRVTVTPVPASPAPGQQVTLSISTTDSAGNAVQNANVNLSGTAGATGAVVTDASGNAIRTFVAPNAPGTSTIVVSGLGVSDTKILQVVVPGGGSIPDAAGPVSSASLSPQPTSISPNTAGSTTNRSKLQAKFLTSGNAGLQNMRVRFEIVPPALGSGETISTGAATVYSDVSGIAEADYIAGTRSSPTNGVNVRVCYKLTDFSSSTDCPNQVAATLTVAGTPLSISISDDNKMEKGLGEIAYIKKFLIQVNDSAGVAVADAIIAASVDITHYGKGQFGGIYPLRTTAPTVKNDSLATVLSGLTTAVVTSSSTVPSVLAVGSPTIANFYNVWCKNEDINRNGFLDVGEDVNFDGVIQPRKAEIIVSYVNGNRTDAKGQMLVQISYGQNMGTWLAYTLRATTGVAGSEGDASKSYITNVLEADVANGSFLTPPFGSNACNVIN